MTVGERVRIIRKAQGLTLDGFGAKVGVSGPAISLMENGKSRVTDRTIRIICSEFRVSETWLRTGEGEMEVPVDHRAEVEAVIRSALEAGPESFKARFIAAVASLSMEEWTALERLVQTFAGTVPGPSSDPEPRTIHDWTPDEMTAKARRQAEAGPADRGKGTDGSCTCSRGSSGTATG